MKETDLYAPVKAFLQGQGYEVKAEVVDCDLVAIRGDEAPVIVELKLSLSLGLLIQGVDRLAITDGVYVAVPAGKGKRWQKKVKGAVKLCRRLGLGLLSVRQDARDGAVIVHQDPVPYHPRKNSRRRALLLKEFQNRVGDPNTGGQTRRAVVTAYRQDALLIARIMDQSGACSAASLVRSQGIGKASSILQKDYYGWFVRTKRGIYDLSPAGRTALVEYCDVVRSLLVKPDHADLEY